MRGAVVFAMILGVFTFGCSAGSGALPAPPVRADDLLGSCPNADVLEGLYRDLPLHFEEDPTAMEPLACQAAKGSLDLTRFQKRASVALLSLRAMTFDVAVPWTNRPLYDWVISTIPGIRFGGPSGWPAGGPIVFRGDSNNCLTSGPPSDRWVSPRSGCGVPDFLAAVVHDVRLAEGPVDRCDANGSENTIAELGGWGVEYLFYRLLAEHSGKFLDAPGDVGSDYYRDEARYAALGICSRRFCHDQCP